jgi:hypothetical protein
MLQTITHECPRCEGVGEMYHGHRDPAMVVPVECFLCEGHGEVTPQVAAEYADFLADAEDAA